MALNADTLLDRIRLKNQLTRWRILALVALVIAVMVGVERGANIGDIGGGGDHIARLKVEDMILDNHYRDEAIAKAKDDASVKAMIVWIDSPGGTVTGGVQLYNDIRAVAEKKPVVAVIRTMGTSAAYMTAIASDHIIAQEGSLTGSVGVIMQTAEFTGLAEKLGIQPITLKSGDLKAVPSPLEKLTPAGRENLQGVIMDIYDMFAGMVQKARKLSPEQMKEISDGRVYTGRQALKAGLIDELGDEQTAISWLQSKKGIDISLKIKDVKIETPKDDWLDEVSGKFWGPAPSSRFFGLSGLVSVWQPGLTR